MDPALTQFLTAAWLSLLLIWLAVILGVVFLVWHLRGTPWAMASRLFNPPNGIEPSRAGPRQDSQLATGHQGEPAPGSRSARRGRSVTAPAR